jgi:hypothetical protein
VGALSQKSVKVDLASPKKSPQVKKNLYQTMKAVTKHKTDSNQCIVDNSMFSSTTSNKQVKTVIINLESTPE